MAQMTDSDTEGERAANIRAEYSAISAKLNQLPSFRFALAGFYLAAVGVIVTHPACIHFVLLIVLTVVLWLVDLRTRQLLANIGSRGKKIEMEYWRDGGWISHMDDTVRVKWLFGGELTVSIRYVSHSYGFDFMFLGILLYSAFQLWALVQVSS
jgi:hypothetical protein